MIRILDQYFATQQYLETKSAYGLLKHYQSPLNNYKFVNDATQPVIILLHIDVASPDLDKEIYDEIKRQYRQNKLNKILIDTSMEDFVRDNFFTITSRLEMLGIDPDDISVITGQNNVPMFQKDFQVFYNTFNVNLFELSYYYFIHEYKKINEVLKPIKPRILTTHAVSYIKNPRKMRRLLHAYYCLKGYDSKMINSWHYQDVYNEEDKRDLCELGVIKDADDWGEIKTTLEGLVSYDDDVQGKGEWIVDQSVVQHAGICFPNETHHSMDQRSRLFPRATMDQFMQLKQIPIFYRYFLTEKTYKNFAYGLPFVNLGIPGSPAVLGSYGYKSWERLMGIDSTAESIGDAFLDAFSAMDKIFNMSLDDLSDIVNSEKSLDYLKHNRERFLEQNEFKRLCNVLDTIYR